MEFAVSVDRSTLQTHKQTKQIRTHTHAHKTTFCRTRNTQATLVEQISKLTKKKDLLLNESPGCSSAVCMKDEVVSLRCSAGRHDVRASLRCSDLCSDNQALRIDNAKLHEALLNYSWPLQIG